MGLYTAQSDLDYLNEHDPCDQCAECGRDMPPGFVRCDACEAKREELEVAHDDPRRI